MALLTSACVISSKRVISYCNVVIVMEAFAAISIRRRIFSHTKKTIIVFQALSGHFWHNSVNTVYGPIRIIRN